MFRLLCTRTIVTLGLALGTVTLSAQQSASVDAVIARIREEGLQRSQVMQTLSYLTDVIGPRLTGSPNLKRANEWTRNQLTTWGLENARLEPWGPFGVGWTLERFSAQVIAPQCIPLIACPKAWSPGVRGTHVGEVIYVEASTEADLEKYRGRLKGAIVLNSPTRDVPARFEPLGRRWTEEELARMAQGRRDAPRGPGEAPRRPSGPGTTAGNPAVSGGQSPRLSPARRLAFFLQEGVAVVVEPSTRGDGGTLFVQSASLPATGSPNSRTQRAPRPWDRKAPKTVPQMVMAVEDYNRLVRMIRQGERPRMAVQMTVRFHDRDLMAYNTLADLPGTDKKDEVVMLGAHLDSWHGATGATDNAVGCAVVMEAMRILKAVGVQPRRTIRVALWTGEEQGLFGSAAYVEQHLSALESAPATGEQGGAAQRRRVNKPDYEKFCVYFNLDNGTGRIRGIYAQGNEAAATLFKEWLVPFHDLGATTVTLSNTGATDHVPFDRVGLPGFQFIQDPIEYSTRTHHSNQDSYDRVQAEDVKQAAVIMAAFAYQAAMREELFPRNSARTSTVAQGSTR